MDIMEAYERDVKRTENKTLNNALVYGTMKLAEEAGEACALVAKHIGQGHDLDKKQLLAELGDVLYFVTYTADKLGYGLRDVIANNVAKRLERYPEGFDANRSVNRG